MKVVTIGGKNYKLPSLLTPFQEEMYVHLIDWKWAHITVEPGTDGGIEYDAILPERYAELFPMIYPSIIGALRQHQVRFPFRFHKYFNHMASSQAANINLFLLLLLHPNVGAILGALKPDFAHLATTELDNGFRIEFWDQPCENLRDKTETSGTDADIAIAYYNHEGDLCLWLIEHKLTEREFTTCHAATSRGRKPHHDCRRSFSELVNDPSACYYHDVRGFRYWEITKRNTHLFPNHADFTGCPFRGGLNQLWRNQLLAISVEQETRRPYGRYKRAFFSVVKHPRNMELNSSLDTYRRLIGDNPRFSTFTSADVLCAAERFDDPTLQDWIGWYRDLYIP